MVNNFHLCAEKLTYVRNARLLFSELSFDLQGGEALQIAGPNGVGKSSLLRMLAGLTTPTTGKVHWSSGKSQLAYLGHKIAVKSVLTVAENLRGTDWVNKPIVDQLKLKNLADVACRKLSAGQLQRLALVKLIVSSAKLWILDEPFTALDQNAISIVVACLAEHLNSGGLLIFTSHQPLNLPNIFIKKIALN